MSFWIMAKLFEQYDSQTLNCANNTLVQKNLNDHTLYKYTSMLLFSNHVSNICFPSMFPVYFFYTLFLPEAILSYFKLTLCFLNSFVPFLGDDSCFITVCALTTVTIWATK